MKSSTSSPGFNMIWLRYSVASGLILMPPIPTGSPDYPGESAG
jgi:hypothetical protein